jgi:hypothetical protein
VETFGRGEWRGRETGHNNGVMPSVLLCELCASA